MNNNISIIIMTLYVQDLFPILVVYMDKALDLLIWIVLLVLVQSLHYSPVAMIVTLQVVLMPKMLVFDAIHVSRGAEFAHS